MLIKDHPKKPMVEIIMGKIKPKKSEENPNEDLNAEVEAIGQDILNAIKANDPVALVEAIKAAMECEVPESDSVDEEMP